MLYLILFGFIFFCFLYNVYVGRKRVWEPPEHEGKLPLVGHAHHFMGDSTHMYKVLDDYSRKSEEMGGSSCFFMGPWKHYMLTDPEDCLTVANECLDKPHIVYGFAKSFLGNGLLTSPESIWKRHRKLLNPAFNQVVLNRFIPIFDKQARILVDELRQEIGKPFNHEHLLRFNNLETICLTSIGVEGKEYSDLQQRYIPMMSQYLVYLSERFKRAWLYPDLIFNWSTLKKKQDEVAKSALELSDTILNVRKQDAKRRATSDNTSKLKPFMELILDLTNTSGFTDEEVMEETNNIVIAGHETSATTLTFLFTLLGSHPEIQDKVYNEVIQVLGDTERELNKDDLSKLVYTEAVVKETVRLYPIAPFIARDVNKRLKLKNCTLEPNVMCIMCVGRINRHVAVWGPDSEKFRPERWLESACIPDWAFAGFGLGKRTCIGKVYATMSMKVTVAHVIRRYHIQSNIDKMVLRWDIVTRPASGHHVTLQLRK